MNTETLKKMNNTDFFNNHRAEALKLIANNLFTFDNYFTGYDIINGKVKPIMKGKCREHYKEFNPCADTRDGKVQRMDLQDVFYNELEDNFKKALELAHTDPSLMAKAICVNRDNATKMHKACESPEAICIAYLDMIRKV